jgi:aminoglycoside/choline kinase family phosphotransferase
MILSETLLHQTRLHFPRFDQAEVRISPIEKGGSGRKFYRIQFSPEQTVVLIKYTRERAENQRYVEIAEFLTAHEVRAPKIYFHDSEEGLIWIEDLGERDLWSHREESWPERRVLYQSALEDVVKLHQIPAEGFASIAPHLPMHFDAAVYRWEQNYFLEHCLGRHFAVGGKTLGEISRLPRLKEIAEYLGNLPRVLVHRDLQSQNIIIREQQAYLIDFQGMRPGLPEYDLASLLYDPYVCLTTNERRELVEFYGAEAEVDDTAFAERFRLCAMQRLMQALGAYGYLGISKGIEGFLQHIPAAMKSLGEVMREIDGLEPLTDSLATL